LHGLCPDPGTASEMRVGDGDLLAARRDGCQAEGRGVRRNRAPCTPPLGLAGEDPRREEITTESHRATKPKTKIDDRGCRIRWC